MNQFIENLGIMSMERLEIIKHKNIMIVGLGGLGGHLANTLARLGVFNLTLVDDDEFSVSNLNRQLFSNHEVIGQSKVSVLSNELKRINPNMNITIHVQKIQNIDPKLYINMDYICDAVDDIKTKIYLEEQCSALNIPLIHGAVAGYYGQVGIIMPNAFILKDIYQDQNKGIEKQLRSPSFTPAIVANLMALEFVKTITEPKVALFNQVMMIDLLNHRYEIVIKKEIHHG